MELIWTATTKDGETVATVKGTEQQMARRVARWQRRGYTVTAQADCQSDA